MSVEQVATVSRPAIGPQCPSSNRIVGLNRRVAMIKVSIPTKEELKRARDYDNLTSPDTAMDSGSGSDVCCILRRM